MNKKEPRSFIGRTIAGKFLLDSLVGEGAMGAVYRARHLSLDKPIAIKVMHAEHAATPAFVQRFETEARAASRLDHPSSVRVIDFGQEPDGLLYLAMELLVGRDLHSVIEDDPPMSPARIVSILLQVLGALAAAHRAGVTHRDLKPENIMVLAGSGDEDSPIDIVKVCDFGIARLAEVPGSSSPGGRHLTGRGVAIGTPEYMSPEQALGEEIDPRSDLYSVGVILFQMLTRTLPFSADTPMGVAFKHVTEDVPSVLDRNPGADPALAEVCRLAMQKKRADRFQSARELRTALRAALRDRGESPADSRFVDAGAAWPVHESTRMRFGSDSSRRRAALPETLADTSAAVQAPARAPAASSRRIVVAAFLAVGVVAVAFGLSRREPTPTSLAASAPPPSLTSPDADRAPALHAEPAHEERPKLEAQGNVDASTAVTLVRQTPILGPIAHPGATESATSPPAPTASVVAIAPAASPPPSTAPEPIIAPPPSATPAVVAAPAPSPTPSPTPDPPIAVDHARVSIGGVTTTNALPSSGVRSAVARLDFLGCYRAMLTATNKAASGTVTLHLSIDSDGYVTSARASGGELGSAAACIEGRARGLRIPNVDTGDASADVALVFSL
jgi:serine/threonine-protein kinase